MEYYTRINFYPNNGYFNQFYTRMTSFHLGIFSTFKPVSVCVFLVAHLHSLR